MVQVFLSLKNPALAKSRLAPLLTNPQRVALVTAMALDVVEAVLAADACTGLTVIAHDRWRRELPRHPLLRAVNEDQLGGGDLNALLCSAVDLVDPACALVLHGDLPFLARCDIAAAWDALQCHDLLLCPDVANSGTNAVGFRRRARPAFCFGRDSFTAHRRLAQESGCRWSVLARAGFARDVDTPADLRLLLQRVSAGERVGPRTSRWATRHGAAVVEALRCPARYPCANGREQQPAGLPL